MIGYSRRHCGLVQCSIPSMMHSAALAFHGGEVHGMSLAALMQAHRTDGPQFFQVPSAQGRLSLR